MERSPGLQDETPPKDTWPKVAVIILNWNGWRDTIECLESVVRLDYPNYKIVVVDNGSIDDSYERLFTWARHRSYGYEATHFWCGQQNQENRVVVTTVNLTNGSRLQIVKSSDNLGFGGGCNLGIDVAISGDESIKFIFLLNNDALITPDCLTALVRVALDQKLSIVGAIVKSYEDGRVLCTGSRLALEPFMIVEGLRMSRVADWWEVDRVIGAAMLIERNVLELRKHAFGYYLDPHLFMYCEELEFCRSTRNMWGIRSAMVGSAVIYHKGGKAAGGVGSPLAYYYQTRNRLILARRLLPWYATAIFYVYFPLTRVIRILYLALSGKFATVVAIIEGLLHGYMGMTGQWRRHPKSFLQTRAD